MKQIAPTDATVLGRILASARDGLAGDSRPTGEKVLWVSPNEPHSGGKLYQQDDGNLVIYRADSTPAWDSKTQGQGENYLNSFLTLADDGILATYGADKSELWRLTFWEKS